MFIIMMDCRNGYFKKWREFNSKTTKTSNLMPAYHWKSLLLSHTRTHFEVSCQFQITNTFILGWSWKIQFYFYVEGIFLER